MRISSFYQFICCLGAVFLNGCVEREFVINSNPQGAVVYVNGVNVGNTPKIYSFIYFGKYDFKIEKDGYQTGFFRERIAPPWFAYPPLDFITENLYPFKIEDKRVLTFNLKPVEEISKDDLIRNALELRERGRNLPEPRTPPEPTNKPMEELPPPANLNGESRRREDGPDPTIK